MANEIVNQWALTGRAKPSTSTDSTYGPVRVSRYGELVVLPSFSKGKYQMADEGSYFVASNPTPGTGIAGIAGTDTFSDQESLLYIKNTATASEGTRIYLDYLKLLITAAGTNGTNHRFVSKMDAAGVDRAGTGGDSITPVCTNMDASSVAPVTMKFGAVASAAASSGARLVGSGILRRATIVVANDEFWFDFGSSMPPQQRPGTLAADSTTNVSYCVAHAPVVIGPQQSFLMGVYAASQTAATSYEFELGFWAR